MHSNSFMHKAVDISVGSLSPTINWGTLKTQEFLVPPKTIQLQLVSLFETLDIVRCKENSFTEKLKDYATVKARELLLGGFLNEEGTKYKNFPKVNYSLFHLNQKNTFSK
mgnify:CR=1 FL=1